MWGFRTGSEFGGGLPVGQKWMPQLLVRFAGIHRYPSPSSYLPPPSCSSRTSSSSPLLSPDILVPQRRCFWTMATIMLSPSPLPRLPALYKEWLEHRSSYLCAYEKVHNAECHAAQQTGREAEQNVISARVAGYLLVELYARRAILSEAPCESLTKQLLSPPQEPGVTEYGLIFRIGELHREYFLRLCMFDFSPMLFSISISLQFGCPPCTQYHHMTCLPPSTLYRI